MLNLLRERCERTGAGSRLRLRTHHTDALAYLATESTETYDLVAAQFFLDCLSQSEVETVAAAISARLDPDGIWLVSEFRIPPGIMRSPAKLLVRTLYLAFQILTGMSVNRLPDHTAALGRAGLTRTAQHCSLFGILSTELWELRPTLRRPPV